MKILVTGGAGFIGSNFVRHLLAGKYLDLARLESVTVLDNLNYAGNFENLESVSDNSRFNFILGDICDFESVYSSLEGQDLVVHFAAESHVDRSINDPRPFFETNVLGTQRLLHAAMMRKVSTFVHVSTDEVYGTISEGSWTESSPLLPNSPYAASKGASDLLARSYYQTYGMDVRITRCSNNYGQNQYPEKVIPLFVTNLLEGKQIPIYGDGANIRDWLHVDDHCQALWLVASRGRPGEIYNIGGGKEMTNLELASLIIKSMGEDHSKIEFVKDRRGHDFRYSLDYSKIARELGYRPSVHFEEGISATIQWYLENEKWWKAIKV